MHTSSSPLPPSRPEAPTEFATAFTSTPRGARLARLFVSHCLDSWGHPYGSDVNETLSLITAELCANAVRHGRVPGRDFHARLTTEADGGPADPDAESGRGLLLVTALADDRGRHRPPFRARQDGVGGGEHPAEQPARRPSSGTHQITLPTCRRARAHRLHTAGDNSPNRRRTECRAPRP